MIRPLTLLVLAALASVLPLSGAAGVPAPEPPPLLDCTGPEGVRPEDIRKAQNAWAKHLRRAVVENDPVAPGLAMAFVLIPPGRFRMGSPEGEADRDVDETPHVVTLTQPFYLSRYPVTRDEYEALIEGGKEVPEKALLPVEHVSWTNARDYAIRLTKERGEQFPYRLPTEAEWEYACRGGHPLSHPFGVGDGRTLSSREANFDGRFPFGGADKGPNLEVPCRVGAYPANAFGLYDMHGNMWQWCADWYGPYPAREAINPVGPEAGSDRVIRGGSWFDTARYCRAGVRGKAQAETKSDFIGFRLARGIK